MKTGCIKYIWINPRTLRSWCQCGSCGRVASRKAAVCRYCGAEFVREITVEEGKDEITPTETS